jgi:hypothetical protein
VEVVKQKTIVPSPRSSTPMRLAAVALVAVLIASALDHVFAAALGFVEPHATYRRIGPQSGPQVYLAGSSTLQYGFLWSEVSDVLGQGMEHWGVPGSSPEVWEQSQLLAPTSNLAFFGISALDMNEDRHVAARAKIVPLAQTLADLRESGASFERSKGVLVQYPLAYVQKAFPTAGDADAVLVGIRGLLRQGLGLSSAAEDRDNALVLPNRPVLDFGSNALKVSDWSKDRVLRRLAAARVSDGGSYSFNGMKQLVLRRMLRRASKQGNVVVAVMPLTSFYLDEVLVPGALKDFEASIEDIQRSFPEIEFIRLDQEPSLRSSDYFSDFFHLNQFGREVATRLFLEGLKSSDRFPTLH